MTRQAKIACTCMLFAALLSGFSVMAYSQVSVKASTGFTQANLVWQSTPNLFADVTRWTDIGLLLFWKRFDFRFGTTVADFQTMRFLNPLSFYGHVGVRLAHLYRSNLFGGGGFVSTPFRNWLAWYLDLYLSIPVNSFTDVWGGIFWEAVHPSSSGRNGSMIGINFGAIIAVKLL